MILNIYAIRDIKTDAYLKPFFVQNDEVAIRAISTSLHEVSELSQHASDYQVFCLGTYDDNAGTMDSVKPRHVAHVDAIQRELLSKAVNHEDTKTIHW